MTTTTPTPKPEKRPGTRITDAVRIATEGKIPLSVVEELAGVPDPVNVAELDVTRATAFLAEARARRSFAREIAPLEKAGRDGVVAMVKAGAKK